ncbi:MAG: rhodanese-like domain-containing protein [Nitriliruptoraceae bacterium]
MDVAGVTVDDAAVLLDVREPMEWQAGHIAGAVNVPLSQLVERQGKIPTDRPILCVCRSGNRSAMVADALADAGYDARNFDGGMLAWLESGGDVVAADGAPGRVI